MGRPKKIIPMPKLPLHKSTINEHQADVAVPTVDDYPGFEVLGSKNGVVYLSNAGGVFCDMGGRIVNVGKRLSADLLKQLVK